MAASDQGRMPGIGEIATGLAGDVQDLVRGELALARAELDQKLRMVMFVAISAVGGALVAFAGLVVFLEGGAALLAFWLPAWASLLIVGALIVLVGALISRGAIAKFSLKSITPERTMASVEKDARLIKEHS